MTIQNIVDTINNTLDSANTPANILPPMLTKYTSLVRPGLSAYKIASKVIQNNKTLGIPTEPNPNGEENMINQYTYNLVKCIIEAIKYDATVQIAIPMQSLLVQATGGNAGGPVTCIGTNLIDSQATGIIQ